MEHRIADLNSTRVKAFLEYHLPGSGIEMLKISEQYLQKLNYEISQSKLKLQGYLSEKTKIKVGLCMPYFYFKYIVTKYFTQT